MIKAEIVADSVNTIGERITTMLVTFPRFILAELNTHRAFSRNSASSRAIPFAKMVKSVQENPFIPIAWQKDHKGMQGAEYFTTESDIRLRRAMWDTSKEKAVESAKELNKYGITKQLCNRLLEPFMWHTVLITSTEWENFFELRCPQYSLFHENIPLSFRSKKDFLNHVHEVEAPEFKNQYDNLTELDWLKINKGQSEIHMMALAEAMWDAYNESTPKQLKAGEWHIPFGDKIDESRIFKTEEWEGGKLNWKPHPSFEDWATEWYQMQKLKIATARCARVSYLNFEGKDDYEADIKLHDRLLESGHMSPFEHCAKASPGRISRNFKGFKQYREIVENS